MLWGRVQILSYKSCALLSYFLEWAMRFAPHPVAGVLINYPPACAARGSTGGAQRKVPVKRRGEHWVSFYLSRCYILSSHKNGDEQMTVCRFLCYLSTLQALFYRLPAGIVNTNYICKSVPIHIRCLQVSPTFY